MAMHQIVVVYRSKYLASLAILFSYLLPERLALHVRLFLLNPDGCTKYCSYFAIWLTPNLPRLTQVGPRWIHFPAWGKFDL